MKLFYGWVIVGAGIVITCLGMGSMMSLGIFLQPMSLATGWSSTSISTAALLNFLCMGPASFVWGALSDRFGTRVVVLSGGVLLGLGLVAASQAATIGQFQILFGMIIGVAAGSFYAPLTATATRGFTRHRSLAVALISAGFAIGSMTIAPFARWLIDDYGWRTAMLTLGALSWLFIIPAALLVRKPPPLPRAFGVAASADPAEREFTVARALAAKRIGAKATALTVLLPFHIFTTDTQMLEDTPAQYKARMQKHAEKTLGPVGHAAQAEGVACEMITVEHEHPYQAIIYTANSKGCDLIVMASHGLHGISAIVLRSETVKVLTHSKIPVLVHR